MNLESWNLILNSSFYFFFLFWESSENRLSVASSGAGTESMNVRIWCDVDWGHTWKTSELVS